MTEKKMSDSAVSKHGPMTETEVKQWLIWAAVALAVCAILSCIWAVVSSARNREAGAILQVESDTTLEFYLNRKGTILGGMGDAKEMQEDHRLEEGIEKLLQGLSEHGNLSDGGAVIFTLRPCEKAMNIDLQRFAEEIHVYSELFLRKRHSGGAVYVHVLENTEIYDDTLEQYQVSLGRAALVEDLLKKNAVLGSYDMERLMKLPIKELSKEILDEKYDTEFLVVTARQVYESLPAEKIMEPVITEPVETPTEAETAEPIKKATEEPTEAPTQEPTEAPTQAPTEAPTQAPTEAPTQEPTEAPTQAPTEAPTQAPTEAPTQAPTEAPTQAPTEAPTQAPTEAPTQASVPQQGMLSPVQSGDHGESIIQQVIPLSP